MRKLLFLLITVCLLSACNRKTEDNGVLQEKSAMQSELMTNSRHIDSVYQTQGTMETEKMTQFVKTALAYTEAYPEEELAPEILMKAGNYDMRLAQATENKVQRAQYAEEAIDIFNKIIKVYPEHPSVKYCYWCKGIIYEEILGMLPSAENEYRDFLHLFPNDSLAPTIQFSLDHLGQSMEQIMEDISAKEQSSN